MAKLEDLKVAWQSQSGISQDRFDQIGAKIQASTDLLQTTIFRRDMRETIASIVVVAGFSPGLWYAQNWLAWSGFAIDMIAGSTLPLVLWRARKRSLVTASAANFRDFVNIEIDYLRRQVQLLCIASWWYLPLMYAGIVLILAGLTAPLRWTLVEPLIVSVYLVVCTVLFVYVWRLNRSALKHYFGPLLDYYVEMRAALDRGEAFTLQPPDPPSALLPPQPRKPMTNRRRLIWLVVTAAATALVASAGYAVMRGFDPRTGQFIIGVAPVTALLMIVASGVWRRASV